MNDIERQIKLEADAVHDGFLRCDKSAKYQLATDLKPVRDLVGNALKSLTDAILAEQLDLKTSRRQMLPKYGVPLLSINHEQLALITLATLLNSICRSEFEDGLAPRRTPVAFEIGQWCRIERILDCCQHREVDVAQDLLSRNRSRHAARRAEELARKADDEDDWAKHYRSHHLGEKLISLALQFAQFDEQPIFEVRTTRQGSGKSMKTTERVALTPAAADWIANHPAALASLPAPVYMPMVVPPRPWTSHTADGGYLKLPLKLLKRNPVGGRSNSFRRQTYRSSYPPSTRCRIRITVLIRPSAKPCGRPGKRVCFSHWKHTAPSNLEPSNKSSDY
jgi:DNA-directed RNA polymerase